MTTVLAIAVPAGPCLAQYDADGRYVPSPGGIPADPYARPIPLYPGTPGAAIGTPIWPRGTQNPPTTTMTPRLPQSVTPPAARPLIPLAIQQCRDGWTAKLHIPKVEFNRRCHLLLSRERGSGR